VRALLSVHDKTGLVELARGLHDLGWELVSSGGTAAAVAGAGIPVVEVADVTGVPEMPGGLVKTLHPRIHAGILADTTAEDHVAYLDEQGVVPIDLVVCNLYPFRTDPSVQLIDIGGPTMVRAAAKNHARVGVVVDPSAYGPVLAELRADGSLSSATRRRLARAAFAHTAAYDAAIVGWLDEGADEVLPATVHLALERVQELRYGENPHQVGARYRSVGTTGWWDGVVQHAGLALSYLNLFDADAAWALVHDLGPQPAVAIIKHANPCGVAVADDLATAYQRAFDCDPRSAFGGIVALNRPVDDGTVERMVAAAQADVVIAPGYGEGVVERLRAKRKNTRDSSVAGRSSCRTRHTSPPPAPTGGSSPGSSRPTRSGVTPRSHGGCAGGCGRTASCSSRAARRGASAPASRTGSRPARSRRRRLQVGPPAGRRRATRSTRSATGSRRRPRRAWPSSSSPAVACATPRSSPPPTSSASPWSSPASATSCTSHLHEPRSPADPSEVRLPRR
jgi:hypothetical protein